MTERLGLYSRCADLHAATSVEDLAGLSLSLLAHVTHCDTAIFAITDNDRGRCAGAFWPNDSQLPRYMDAYEQYWQENPIGRNHIQAHSDHTVRLADVIERSDLEKSGYYNEYLRRAQLRDTMSGYMGRRGRYRLALTTSRSRGYFSAAERDAMEIVRRHAVVAFWNLATTAELRGTPIGVEDILESGLHTGMVIRDRNAVQKPAKRIVPLTPSERTILKWMVEGKSNPEIAIILGCSVRTVHKHVEHILQKLCVENRTTAVVRAIAMRLFEC